ncbi:hypothetical protein [Erythrobacter sp.]|uniref:hypothetical protein n=1 Tax=Erythrobacter sp. TaxID=1042 RepID=UPI0025EE84E8|nr:hypothetical protein [Erythrobacter sp.]
MFEKTDPVYASLRPPLSRRAEDGTRLRRSAASPVAERFEPRAVRRAGDALRAVEWSEITARLNAARDLRLLLRNESRGQSDVLGASFGDAAASYFAMIDDNQPGVNLDALECSNGWDDRNCARAAIRHDAASQDDAADLMDAPGGDARDKND